MRLAKQAIAPGHGLPKAVLTRCDDLARNSYPASRGNETSGMSRLQEQPARRRNLLRERVVNTRLTLKIKLNLPAKSIFRTFR